MYTVSKAVCLPETIYSKVRFVSLQNVLFLINILLKILICLYRNHVLWSSWIFFEFAHSAAVDSLPNPIWGQMFPLVPRYSVILGFLSASSLSFWLRVHFSVFPINNTTLGRSYWSNEVYQIKIFTGGDSNLQTSRWNSRELKAWSPRVVGRLTLWCLDVRATESVLDKPSQLPLKDLQSSMITLLINTCRVIFEGIDRTKIRILVPYCRHSQLDFVTSA